MHIQSCDIETAKEIILLQNPNQACLVVGPHGCGKSELMYQVAKELRDDLYKDPQVCAEIGILLSGEGKMGDLIASNGGHWKYEFGLPVIERRLSQMSEGELTGVPRIQENTILKHDTTKFANMDFMAITYKYPVVLFFDELNRAFLSLRQATFQIADSKIFLGNKLHPNTRVMVAANIGPMYQADDFDVAEFSRYAVLGMTYNTDVWMKWANKKENRVHSLITGYIGTASNALYVDDKKFATNAKFSDPRAWTKIGRRFTELDEAGKLQELIDSESKLTFFASAIVGPHEGQAFSQYCKENAFFFGVEDVVKNWPEVSRKISEKRSDKQKQIILELASKIEMSISDCEEIWTSQNREWFENTNKFMSKVPAELYIQLTQGFMKLKDGGGNDKLRQGLSHSDSLSVRMFEWFKVETPKHTKKSKSS